MGATYGYGKYRKKTNKKDLPKENLALVPFGEGGCNICRLPFETLKELHMHRIQDNWSYSQIRAWLKAYGISPSPNIITAHFNSHVAQSVQILTTLSKCEKTAKMLGIDENSLICSNKELEGVYFRINQIAKIFVDKVHAISEQLGDCLDTNLIAEQMQASDNKMQTMLDWAKLARESRNLVHELTALRAPKVIVTQFIEKALEEVFFETGNILQFVCTGIQVALTKELNQKQIDISNEIFATIYKAASDDFEMKMRAMARSLLQKIMENIEDIEKTV